MIDEKDVAERFHSAFDALPPAGAAERLRSTLLRADDTRPIQPRAMPLGLHLSLRILAALALIAVVIAASATFVALHVAITRNVPANQPTLHAMARSSLGMVSATVGWEQSSWVDVNGLHHILRTTDGGVHWTDVSPPANLYAPAGKGSVFAVGGSASVYVLDGNHLWLGQIAPGTGHSQITTLSTADGGRTWERGESFRADSPLSPDTNTCPECAPAQPTLYFLDPNHGWMLVQFFNTISLDVAPGEQNQLYQTTDGGRTWHEIAHVDAIAAPGERFVNSLCSWEAVSFESPEDGWLKQDCRGANAGADLLVTHDGGTTWSALSLPSPADAHGAALPVVFDGTHAMVQSFLLGSGGKPYVLLTADGGLTWTVRSLPAGGTTVLDFLDSRYAWVVNGAGELYRTTDGALTWSRIATSLPFSQSTPEEGLYFVDPRNGFAMATTPADVSQSELWKTTDGGQTWSRVGLVPPAMSCPISGCTSGNRP